MFGRRIWLASVMAAMTSLLTSRRTAAQQTPPSSPTSNSTGIGDNNTKFLEDQLRTSLRVVTEGQREYIRQIVELVRQGRLPRPLVNLVARWAVERNPSVPFPYFRYALKLLARRRGIVVP